MSLRSKLLLIVLFVAMVPITVSAWISLRIHQKACEQNLLSLHQVVASREAQRVSLQLKALQENLERLTTNTFSWDELSEHELEAALWLLYRSDDDVVAVVLHDANHKLVTRAAYLTDTTADEEPGHLAAPASIVTELVGHLPHRPTTFGTVYGEPFLLEGDQAPILPIGISLHEKKAAPAPWTIGIAVSLRTLCKRQPNPVDIEVWVVDAALRNLCATTQFASLSPIASGGHEEGPAGAGLSKAGGTESAPAIVTYTGRDGQPMLSASVELAQGWRVIAVQPTATAFAASRNMHHQAILWIVISVAIALISGLILCKGITEPVQRLVTGARELAKGNLEHRIESAEKDEFGRLARAFNHMAAELSARDTEIRGWNVALQDKVRDRTLAIEQYHQSLLQAEKSATVARITAGVASEINDPLTGILGAVQLLAARARSEPHGEQEAHLLANAEEGALRIRALIKRVQALGQRQPRSQLRPVIVQDLVVSALGLLEQSLASAQAEIQVVRLSAGTVPAVLGNFTQLEQALLQVLTNAVAACTAAHPTPSDNTSSDATQPDALLRKGRILVQTEFTDKHLVTITVSDDGVGIPQSEVTNIFEPFVTLRDSRGPGLGLTIARRIVEEHGGKIWAEPNEVAGATVRIQLPIAEVRAK